MGGMRSVGPLHPQTEQAEGALGSCGLRTAHFRGFCIKGEEAPNEETEIEGKVQGRGGRLGDDFRRGRRRLGPGWCWRSPRHGLGKGVPSAR